MELATIDRNLYQPTFDPQTGTYQDVSPFKHRSRKNPVYECRCQVGSFFHTNSIFKVHCKKKTHQMFLTDYEYYYKDADIAKQEIKEYRIENEKLRRKLQKYEGIIRLREQEIDFLNGIGDAHEKEGQGQGESDDEFVDADDHR